MTAHASLFWGLCLFITLAGCKAKRDAETTEALDAVSLPESVVPYEPTTPLAPGVSLTQSVRLSAEGTLIARGLGVPLRRGMRFGVEHSERLRWVLPEGGARSGAVSLALDAQETHYWAGSEQGRWRAPLSSGSSLRRDPDNERWLHSNGDAVSDAMMNFAEVQQAALQSCLVYGEQGLSWPWKKPVRLGPSVERFVRERVDPELSEGLNLLTLRLKFIRVEEDVAVFRLDLQMDWHSVRASMWLGMGGPLRVSTTNPTLCSLSLSGSVHVRGSQGVVSVSGQGPVTLEATVERSN